MNNGSTQDESLEVKQKRMRARFKELMQWLQARTRKLFSDIEQLEKEKNRKEVEKLKKQISNQFH